MAKGDFHLGPNGPGRCSVDPSNPNSTGCPYGGESGEEDHYKTREEAEVVYGKRMESEGHGVVAPSTSQKKTVRTPFQRSMREGFRRRLNDLVSDSSYGVSKGPRGSYVADSSEGLERLQRAYAARLSDDDAEPQINYEEDSDGEVVSSVYIPQLGLEIQNQNVDRDMDEVNEFRQIQAEGRAHYWKTA